MCSDATTRLALRPLLDAAFAVVVDDDDDAAFAFDEGAHAGVRIAGDEYVEVVVGSVHDVEYDAAAGVDVNAEAEAAAVGVGLIEDACERAAMAAALSCSS